MPNRLPRRLLALRLNKLIAFARLDGDTDWWCYTIEDAHGTPSAAHYETSKAEARGWLRANTPIGTAIYTAQMEREPK